MVVELNRITTHNNLFIYIPFLYRQNIFCLIIVQYEIQPPVTCLKNYR